MWLYIFSFWWWWWWWWWNSLAWGRSRSLYTGWGKIQIHDSPIAWKNPITTPLQPTVELLNFVGVLLQEYLRSLHELHEDWLIRQTKFKLPAPVLVSFVFHFFRVPLLKMIVKTITECWTPFSYLYAEQLRTICMLDYFRMS